MNVVLVIPTLKQGGAERVISELANSWVLQDINVHIILLADAKDFYDIASEVKIHRLGFKNRGRIKRIFDEYKILVELRGLIKSIEPRFVLSFMTKYNIFTILATFFLDTKVFVSDRDNIKQTIFIGFLRKYLYRYTDGIISQTSFSKEILEKSISHHNIRVIPNPLRDVEEFPHIKREKIIINVGRLVVEKGQQYLLESFSKLENSDWQLVILGEGPLREQLEEQIVNLGLEDRVFLLGARRDVDFWLAKSSIFAFTSISEGFPNALVEAMSSGLPCVSFDCDAGPRDLIENEKNGFLVKLKDCDEFTKRLTLLINDRKRREDIGLEAKKISKYLSSKEITNRFLKFCINEEIGLKV